METYIAHTNEGLKHLVHLGEFGYLFQRISFGEYFLWQRRELFSTSTNALRDDLLLEFIERLQAQDFQPVCSS